MKQIFRSKAAFVLGWIWVVFAAVMAADLIIRFNGAPSVVAGAVLAVLTALIYITSLRPATVLREDGVLVRNPFRDTFLPWTAIDDIRVSHAIQIEHGDGKIVRCWTPQASARERASATRRGTAPPRRGRFTADPTPTKAEQAALDAVAGRTHADFVAQQLTERMETAKRRAALTDPAPTEPPTPRVTWSIASIAISILAIALVIAAFAVS